MLQSLKSWLRPDLAEAANKAIAEALRSVERERRIRQAGLEAVRKALDL